MEEDPCYTDRSLSDSPDKFDICLVKISEATVKKTYPLGVVESKRHALNVSACYSNSRKHIDSNDLVVINQMWNFKSVQSFDSNIHNTKQLNMFQWPPYFLLLFVCCLLFVFTDRMKRRGAIISRYMRDM